MTTIIILAIAQVLEFLPALGAALKGLSEKSFGKIFMSYCVDYVKAWDSLSTADQKKLGELIVSLSPNKDVTLVSIYNASKIIISSIEGLDKQLSFLEKTGLGYLNETVKTEPNNINGILEILEKKELSK